VAVVVIFIDRNVISEQREQEKKNTAVKLQKYSKHIKVQFHKITNHHAKFNLTQEKKEIKFQSYIDKIKWHIRQTTSHQIQHNQKNGNVRKRHSTKVPNWDRMWSLNGNDITCCSIFITPQGHSLSSLGVWLHLPVSMANLCDDNLNRVVYTRSRSGILSTFPTY